MKISLYLGDCLQEMKRIPDGSIDLILTDPPYGITACKWDSVIPLAPLWEQYKRVIKPRGAIVLFGSQPFTSALVMSNPEWFRFAWVWQKTVAGNFMNAKRYPMKHHEDILLFAPDTFTYNPQMERGEPYEDSARPRKADIYSNSAAVRFKQPIQNTGTRYPSSIQRVPNPNNGNQHPTQKPVALLEYLIRTYTREGETILDSCMGSGSTGAACVNTGRDFIGIELDEGYFQTAKARIEQAQEQAR